MNKGLKEIRAIFFLGCLIFLPFASLIFDGRSFIDSGMIYCDLTKFFYALKVWYKNQLLLGTLPFWTNQVGNGYPVFAEGQIAALYPPNLLLYSFLPVLLAFNLNIFLHFLLAAFFTYLFSRISLRLSQAASILAALTYAFSGFFLARLSYVHMIFVIAYFPLAFLLIERLVSTRRLKFSLLLAIVFALQVLAGHTEMFFYSLTLSFLFFLLLLLFSGRDSKGSLVFFFFFLAFLLGMLLSSVQILSNWEIVQNSHRAEGLTFESATHYVWPISTFKLFVSPRSFDHYQAEEDYHPSNPTTFSVPTVYGYVGILSLAFALLAAVFLFKKRDVFIFVILALFAFLWAQGRFSPLFAIMWAVVPVIRLFRAPVKLLFSLEFFLAILAGFGFDFLRERLTAARSNLSRFGASISILIVLLVYGDLLYNNWRLQPTVSGKEWLSSPQAVSFLKERLDEVFFQTYSHGTNNLDYQTTKDVKLQKDFQNILPADLNLIFDLPNNREDFSLFLKRQKMLNSENTILDLEKGILRLPPRLKKSLALQGVKFLLSDLPFEDSDLSLVKEIPFSQEVEHMAFLKSPYDKTVRIKVEKTHIYENENAYPRINFVSQVKSLEGKSEDEVLEALLTPDFDPTQEVILEEAVDFETEDKEVPAALRVEKYEEQKTEIRVISEKPGFLVLARTFYPGWKAFIDGEKTKIYRANYAFQAVAVPEGEHLIEFSFEPTYWRLGAGLSIGALFITMVGLSYCLLRKNE